MNDIFNFVDFSIHTAVLLIGAERFDNVASDKSTPRAMLIEIPERIITFIDPEDLILTSENSDGLSFSVGNKGVDVYEFNGIANLIDYLNQHVKFLSETRLLSVIKMTSDRKSIKADYTDLLLCAAQKQQETLTTDRIYHVTKKIMGLATQHRSVAISHNLTSSKEITHSPVAKLFVSILDTKPVRAVSMDVTDMITTSPNGEFPAKYELGMHSELTEHATTREELFGFVREIVSSLPVGRQIRIYPVEYQTDSAGRPHLITFIEALVVVNDLVEGLTDLPADDTAEKPTDVDDSATIDSSLTGIYNVTFAGDAYGRVEKVIGFFQTNSGLVIPAEYTLPEDWRMMYGTAKAAAERFENNKDGIVTREIILILQAIAESRARVMRATVA